MPCAFRIGERAELVRDPVVELDRHDGLRSRAAVDRGGGTGTVCHANASGEVAVRSTAGSTVENDSMSSLELGLACS